MSKGEKGESKDEESEPIMGVEVLQPTDPRLLKKRIDALEKHVKALCKASELLAIHADCNRALALINAVINALRS